MSASPKKILFVNSEIFPYLEENPISHIGRYLPQGIQERHNEIRSFMPRYGCIGERKNQLHEVIRLSGMNIVVGDVDRPLVIKVASISSARMQVYFIENDDFFKRRQLYADETGKFCADNAERTVFFARGVLETAKKLRWAPDIIHCHGWITHLVPAYLKKAYKDDPIFAQSKVVLSLYDDVSPEEKFSSDFAALAAFGNVSPEDLPLLKEKPDALHLAKTAASYSDAVILGSENIPEELVSFCRGKNLPLLGYNALRMEDGGYIDDYNAFYDSI